MKLIFWRLTLCRVDLWYVVPVKAFAPRKCLRFYPEGENSLGQYEKYREAWWLMGVGDERIDVR